MTYSHGVRIKSPIYCDNRITLGYPKVRQDIRDGLSELITEHFDNVEVISEQQLLVFHMLLIFLKTKLTNELCTI